MKRSKFILITLIGIFIALFFIFDLKQYLTLDHLKSKQQAFEAYYAANMGMTVAVYMLIYIAVTAMSLPGATVMSLAGGAVFGLWVGTIVISFASTIGATLAFLVSRLLLRDYVQKRFGDRLAAVNQGIEKEGAFYLFTLRLLPIFPFFLVNLLMGVSPIRTEIFYLVSQIGMLPATMVYINAGTQLAQIQTLSGIFSPKLIFSFVLLGIFPLIANKIVRIARSKKILSAYPKPSKFDYNLAVIGAGSAGLVTSYIAAAVRAKVVLIEKHRMGGDCLNTGCVPSKALIRSAKILSYVRKAKQFGFKKAEIEFDFADIMERVHRIIRTVAPHDSVERYTSLGVDCIHGQARITSPYTIEVGDKIITARSIVIATGARPSVPKIPGLEKVNYLTSDSLWNLRKLPQNFVVIGGGPIGCELAQTFSRLGSRVTLVHRSSRLLPREDEEISDMIQHRFHEEGIKVLLRHRIIEVRAEDNQQILVCEHNGTLSEIGFDEILIAICRTPNVSGFGLEELGVSIGSEGTIAHNEFLQTDFPNIFCAGDVAGPYQFTHTAAHQAWYAAVNALFGDFKSFRADYRAIPWATFTDPEVARVGLNEQEAIKQKIDYEVTRYKLEDSDRAIADSENFGMVKVLTRRGTDKILGVTIVGADAGNMIAEYVLAMTHNIGLNKILKTIHIYPTLAEANKYAAGEWKKAHKPEKMLKWIEKFHARRR